MHEQDSTQGEPSGVVISRYRDCDQCSEHLKQAQIEYLQIGPGRFQGQVAGVALAEGGIFHTGIGLRTVYRGRALPGLIYWHVLRTWKGVLAWNGQELERPTLTQHGEGEEWLRRGSDVEGIGMVLRGSPLLAAAAALAGLAPGERAPVSGPQRPTVASTALADLMCRVGRYVTAKPTAFASPAVRRAVEAALATAAIESLAEQLGSRDERPGPGPDRKRIVRLAEARFAAAEGGPVSLADLCQATGVSARTLGYAFQALCGVSPLRYFKLRRLGIARRMLREGPAERGAVKRAALHAGLTELGRFAVEYRTLFGERPSATLSRGGGAGPRPIGPRRAW